MNLPKWFTLKPKERSDEQMRNLESTSFPGIPYEDLPCQHEWKERTRSYAPPYKQFDNISSPNTELTSMLLLGVTTIIDECTICGDLRKESFLGSPDPQLDELLTKSTEYGPQFIERDGNTYCIQRYLPPPQPMGIPLR